MKTDLFEPEKPAVGDGFEQTVAAYGRAIISSISNPKFTEEDARAIIRAAMTVAVELKKSGAGLTPAPKT